LNVVDLFAGAGGWDYAATLLGYDVVGFENDRAAICTRLAANFTTINADLATYPPYAYTKPFQMLLASPPCQAFSIAGKRLGEEDPRGKLVHVPLEWVFWHQPMYVAFEQVPGALRYWERAAYEMRGWGYSVWTGVLNAEQHGVPQTRQRAILIARRDEKEAKPPPPTHSRYYSRTPERLDPSVLPWISMAKALGWEDSDLVRTRGDRQTPGGNLFSVAAQDGAATEKVRSWFRERPAYTLSGGGGHTGGAEPFSRAERRAMGLASGTRPAPTLVGTRRSDEGMIIGRKLAPGEERNPAHGGWTLRNGRAEAGASDGVRISVEEAALLQSFPHDFPWRGARTAQFQQIGNAIPPRLAHAILVTLTT
jgi:DNA (cytosine-5)-methyltransferase 1